MAIEHAAACVLSEAAVMLLSPSDARSDCHVRRSDDFRRAWGGSSEGKPLPNPPCRSCHPVLCGKRNADRSGACTVKRRIRHRQSVRRRSCYRCGLHCLQRRSVCGRKVGNLLCGSLSGGELCGGISSASGGNRSPFASGSVSDYDELLRADVCFFARDEKRPGNIGVVFCRRTASAIRI